MWGNIDAVRNECIASILRNFVSNLYNMVFNKADCALLTFELDLKLNRHCRTFSRVVDRFFTGYIHNIYLWRQKFCENCEKHANFVGVGSASATIWHCAIDLTCVRCVNITLCACRSILPPLRIIPSSIYLFTRMNRMYGQK